MDIVRYTSDGEWSALYVDGGLDRVGDHYMIDERISKLTEIITIYSDAFFLNGDSREDVAKTLKEVIEFDKIRGLE